MCRVAGWAAPGFGVPVRAGRPRGTLDLDGTRLADQSPLDNVNGIGIVAAAGSGMPS